VGWRPAGIRLPIAALGCCGGVAAVAFALRHLAAFPDHRVLIVAVEVPSLTFQHDDRSIDNLSASLVFGDGAAATVMGGGPSQDRLTVRGVASHLLPGS